MKKLLAIAALSLVGLAAQAQDVPAFPGAEGHGRYTTGGRGTDEKPAVVRHVTTLEDNNSQGSFRWAVSGNDPKIVVFDVAGVIALKSDLTMGENTTIAGQTAPYPGITLRYFTVRPKANTIMRFISLRRGEEINVNDGADATWQRNVTGVMLDHCSFSWCIDEIASFYDNNNFTMQWCTLAESLTNSGHTKGAHGYGGIWGGKLASFHHNLLAHVENRAPRFNGARYGWTGYKNNKNFSEYNWENTVQAENVDFRNCVMYNWGSGKCYGGPGGGQINIVNNYYKAGPATGNKTTVTQIDVASSSNADSDHPEFYGMSSRYFIEGNYVSAASTPENYDWKGVNISGTSYTIDGEKWTKDVNNYYGNAVEHKNNDNSEPCVKVKMDAPCPAGAVTTHTAVNAFDKVVQYAGQSLYRDREDTRYAEEVSSGTATYKGCVTGKSGIIDIVWDVYPYTIPGTEGLTKKSEIQKKLKEIWAAEGKTYTDAELKAEYAKYWKDSNFMSVIPDPDGDGIPGTYKYPDGNGNVRPADFDKDNDGVEDGWELANGMDPTNPDDALLYTVDSKKWYRNIEVYINSIVEDIMKNENKDAVTGVDEYYPTYTPSTGIEEIKNVAKPSCKFEYYSLNGTRIAEPVNGISIRKTIFSDGTVQTDKVIKK